jgi:hypothetical protein
MYQRSELNLFHNFTYFIAPVLGDQVEQVEDRLTPPACARRMKPRLRPPRHEGRRAVIGADTHFDMA